MNAYHFSMQCLTSPFNTTGCQSFWFYGLLVFLAICFLIIVTLVISIFKERTIIGAYNKRMQVKAAVAERDVMEQHKWNGDA
jgi:5-bromo-4-chloroindolyl phosphate hydrolysis protein